MVFCLEKFEASVYRREHDEAMLALLSFLKEINQAYGNVDSGFEAKLPRMVGESEANAHIWARIASAISALFADLEFHIPAEAQLRVLNAHRWIAAIFSASAFRNTDHVMRLLNQHPDGDIANFKVASRDLLKFCMLYSNESDVSLDLDALWARDKALAAGLCLALLSPRFQGTRAAHDRREALLPWLSQRLAEVERLDALPIHIVHAVYMTCSYATLAAKHDIKRPINALVIRHLQQAGLTDIENARQHTGSGKPVMLVVFEWFKSGHSIYRTHSLTIEAARERFHVVGIGYAKNIDDKAKAVFDEFVTLEPGSVQSQLNTIREQALARNAQILYMPSVGMAFITMYLSNLRIAPLQIMGLGHPATSHASAIDYVVVEEDYVGDPTCFSEKLLRLPRDGMPYRPSAAIQGPHAVAAINDTVPAVINIAVCATTMKLNPGFLEACAEIARRSVVPVHFSFLLGDGIGLVFAQVQRAVRHQLGNTATVHSRRPYATYMELIAECDMFINPFPFGNTNGIIDTVGVGLVGVCKTGPEVHEHIDQALFGRLGLPEWLVTETVEAYIQAAVRLANEHAERNQIRRQHAGPDKLQVLFQGRPEIMGMRFQQLLEEGVVRV